MKGTRLLLCTLLVLGIAATMALAQQGAGRGPGGGGGGGGAGGPGAGGGQGMMQGGGPPMGMRGGPSEGTAVTATEKYLFIVRGNTVFQLDITTLEIIKQKELPEPERRGPGGQGQGRAARQRPPVEGDAGGDKQQ